MTKLIVAVAAVLTLAGCAPVMQQANEVGGIVKSDNGGAALRLADEHCHKFGKVARISGQNVWESTTTFDCVTP